MTERFANLLLAHDFSPDSDAALEVAAELARSFGATLHLLHVWQRPVEVLSPYEVPLPESVVHSVREASRRRLEEVAGRLREADLVVKEHVREGSPAETLAESARELGADLLVMGTRGRTGLAHVLLGSVAERTLRLAPCPVLTVRTRARD